MASRLADIYKSEMGRGGGLGSAIGKRLREKIDPRQMFDQSGLLTAMFPSLKAYNATAKREEREETNSGGNMSSAVMGAVLASSNLTAKNTMVLPAMARDMNLMRQNVAKLVKLQGGKPAMKGDMFFKKAGERNTLFESALGKMGGVTAKGGKGLNLFGLSSEKDGQTPETALYVKSVTGEEGGLTDWLKSLAAGGAIRGLASIAGSIISSPAFIASAAIGGTALLARYMKERNDEELKKPENANVPRNVTNAARNQATAIATGNLTKGTANDIIKRLTEDKLKGAAADSFCNEVVRGVNLAKVLEVCDDGLKQKYLEMVAKDTEPAPAATEPTPPPTSVPDTTNDARRGRGYISPEPTIPSNAVISGTGGTISTGSGGMVVSPSYETAPTPMPAPASMPRPTPAPSAPTNTTPSNVANLEGGVSDALVNHIKKQEGFSPKAFWDHQQYSIGYGTKANNKDEVIDEKEAEKRLRVQIADTRSKVIKYGIKKGYSWNDNQVDALSSFAYNLGIGSLDQVTNNGTRSNLEIAAAIPKYNKASGKVESGLEKRRDVELAMFNAPNSGTQIASVTNLGTSNSIESAPKPTALASTTSTSTSIPSGTQIASASSELTSARYAGRAQMRQQPPAPVVVNAGGSGDTRILTTQKSTPYNGEFYSSLVSSKAL